MPDEDDKRLNGLALKSELAGACSGLTYLSETDSPVVPIFVVAERDLPLRKFVSAMLSDKSGTIVEKPVSYFFDRLTADRNWHSENDTKSVRRYRKLRKLMLDNLADVTVFRAGRVRVDIYVLGRDSEGNIAGVRTTAVET